MIAVYQAATAHAGVLRIEALGHGAAFGTRLARALRALHARTHTPTGYARGINAMLDGAWCRIECPGEHGILLRRGGNLYSWQCFTVNAAHYLPAVPAGHPCRRMHGHTFRIIVHACASPGPLRRACVPIQNSLQRRCLNDVPGLANPTSERLACWVLERLPRHLNATGITVLETTTSGCHYEDGAYRIWKHFNFEAAVQGRYGHGYRLCLHLAAPLDATMGWTIDYGEIPARLAPVLETLDHHDLGTADADPGHLLRRIHAQAAPRLPIHQLELYAAPHVAAVY